MITFNFCFYCCRTYKDIYKKNCEGWTPLMYACHNKHEDTVSLLIKVGTPINDVNYKNQTALMLACTTGNLTIAKSVFHVSFLMLKFVNIYTIFYSIIGIVLLFNIPFIIKQITSVCYYYMYKHIQYHCYTINASTFQVVAVNSGVSPLVKLAYSRPLVVAIVVESAQN